MFKFAFFWLHRASSTSGAGSTALVKPVIAKAVRVAASRVKNAVLKRPIQSKNSSKVRVCVLNSSYENTDSPTIPHDSYHCTPAHWVTNKRYNFHEIEIHKRDSFRHLRELIATKKYDVFFNLCDGAKDEKRAGVDVLHALEAFNAAFTGTDSKNFEPNKIDMKILVSSAGVQVPNFVLLESDVGLAKKCRHLRFPVIVKHVSGYASVGIKKDNRCDNLDELRVKVRAFIKEFDHAMVEEFIRGREGTVLATADPKSPFGIRIFDPLMFNFLKTDDDFAHFDNKWTVEYGKSTFSFLPSTDSSYGAIMDMARNAFRYVLMGVGYGRCDFRIDQKGTPYFLEINPNCGMWYDGKDGGGDFADLMVTNDTEWNHETFVNVAIRLAVKHQEMRKPWYFISHDSKGNFTTRATQTVTAGRCLFGDAVHHIPVLARAISKLGSDEPTVGCVIQRADGVNQMVSIRHSCEPNMHFLHGPTLLFASKRSINVGEELTVDYATLRDESMPTFPCSCGTSNCRSVIFAMPIMPRNVELATMRRLLREKKRLWRKEKEDKEAERLLSKRTKRSSLSEKYTASTTNSSINSAINLTNTYPSSHKLSSVSPNLGNNSSVDMLKNNSDSFSKGSIGNSSDKNYHTGSTGKDGGSVVSSSSQSRKGLEHAHQGTSDRKEDNRKSVSSVQSGNILKNSVATKRKE